MSIQVYSGKREKREGEVNSTHPARRSVLHPEHLHETGFQETFHGIAAQVQKKRNEKREKKEQQSRNDVAGFGMIRSPPCCISRDMAILIPRKGKGGGGKKKEGRSSARGESNPSSRPL